MVLQVRQLHGPKSVAARDAVKPLYEAFCERAATDYGWEYAPLPYEVWANSLAMNDVFGYAVSDTSLPNPAGPSPKPVAFMLYTVEPHGAVEINLLFHDSTNAQETPNNGREKSILDAVMQVFLVDLADIPGWQTVSFPMLGHQAKFIRSLMWYRFRAMGQAVVELDFTNPACTEVIQRQSFETLPDDLSILSLQAAKATRSETDLYEQAAHCIAESFAKSSDALWDPRFRNLEGAHTLVTFITSGQMGEHWPECTQILLQAGKLVGFCFVISAGSLRANVPLIGISPSLKRKKLGVQLLYTAMMATVKQVIQGHRVTQLVSATLDTDNLPAIQMYRRLGFIERTYYPHAYLTRERWSTWKTNQWCETGVEHQPDPSRLQAHQIAT